MAGVCIPYVDGLLLSGIACLVVVYVDLLSRLSDVICIVRGPIYSGHVSLLLKDNCSYSLTLLNGAEAEYIFLKNQVGKFFYCLGCKNFPAYCGIKHESVEANFMKQRLNL